MKKKSTQDKLMDSGDLPKIVHIAGDDVMAKRFGVGDMLIAPPLFYDQIMNRVPHGKLTTSVEIRNFLAEEAHADFTCPLTAGIFINIVAKASQEREDMGMEHITPYWRTLKKDGELNEKYPGGMDHQKLLLELEGHEIIKRGKRYYVSHYQQKLFHFDKKSDSHS